METTMVHWGYVGILEEKWELPQNIGVILGSSWGYMKPKL